MLEVRVLWKSVHGEGRQHQDVLHGASRRSLGQRGVTWEWGRRVGVGVTEAAGRWQIQVLGGRNR